MVFPDYTTKRLTLERVKSVIEFALDEMEFGEDFLSDVAAEAAFCWLSHSACWDDVLEKFCQQLEGNRPEDMEDDAPLAVVQALSVEVAKGLYRIEAAEYERSINKDELTGLIRNTAPDILEKRPPDMTEEEFVDLLLHFMSAAIVGGFPFAEDEFLNYMEFISKPAVIEILKKDKEEN